MNENELRSEMVRITIKLDALGLNHGNSGNLSARFGEGMLITPLGMGAEGLMEDDIVFVQMDGSSHGRREPSGEWLLHRDILAKRPEIGAVVHAHSPAATALACMRREIPPFHYMIAMLGGNNVRCAKYATFGTQEFSDHAITALHERKACLLASHGMIAAGVDLAEAFELALEVENLSELYMRTLQIGQPVLLNEDELQDVRNRFAG